MMILRLLTALLTVPVLLSAAPVTVENSVIASVNGEPILLQDVLKLTAARERTLQSVYQDQELYDRVLKLRRDAVEQIIDRKLLVAAYLQAEFRLSPQELERGLDELSENAGVRTRRELAAKLRAEGIPFEEFRQQVHEQLMAQVMLVQQYKIRVYVSPRDIRAYYDAHPEEFGEPERWQLTLLELPADADARRSILAELQKNPGAFDALSGNARSTTIRKTGLRPAWITAAEPAAPGKICGPVISGDKQHCFRIDRILPAEVTPFAGVETAIREKLERDARQEAAKAYLQELRDDAIIRVML